MLLLYSVYNYENNCLYAHDELIVCDKRRICISLTCCGGDSCVAKQQSLEVIKRSQIGTGLSIIRARQMLPPIIQFYLRCKGSRNYSCLKTMLIHFFWLFQWDFLGNKLKVWIVLFYNWRKKGFRENGEKKEIELRAFALLSRILIPLVQKASKLLLQRSQQQIFELSPSPRWSLSQVLDSAIVAQKQPVHYRWKGLCSCKMPSIKTGSWQDSVLEY